ncbi:hypothetical protein B0H16DRAFT_1654035, partial [Mycena metata]
MVSGNKYGGPTSYLLFVEDAAGAAAIDKQSTFGVHTAFGCWMHEYEKNADVSNWVVAHLDITGSVKDPAQVAAWARAGMMRTAFNHGPSFHKLDQQTQSKGGPASQRVFDALNTIHAEVLPHPTSPVVTIYMEPVTDDPGEQERLYTILRKLNFAAGSYGFRSRSHNGHPTECALCKSGAHPSFLCPYNDTNVGWWGPPAQLSDLNPAHP